MDILKYTTKVRKGQHLTAEERHDIEVHLKDGWSTYKIAKHLGRSYNTVKDEIERGTVLLYNGKVKRYKASVGEQVYKAHRQNSAKKYRALETSSFLQYVAVQFKNKGWSLDACFGNALVKGLFPRNEMVCTKTLYNYVDLGLLPLRAQTDRHPGYAPLDTIPAFVKEQVSPQFYEVLETLCHHFRISYDFLTDDTYSEPIAYEFFKRFYDGVKAGDFERCEENPPLLNVAMPVQTRTDVQWEWVDSCRVDENLLFAKRKATMRAGNQPRKVPLTIEVFEGLNHLFQPCETGLPKP